MKIYYLYAERHSDYGRTEFGYYKNPKTAQKVKDTEHENAKKNKRNSDGYKVDGYFESDWELEEIEVDES